MASPQGIGGWDHEADVVVLGSGMAGTVTAVEAYDTDPGAEILILEKMPERLRGGSGRCAGQYLYAPRPDQLEELKAYHRALNFSNPSPEDVVDAWAEAVVTQRPWLERMAADVGMQFVHLMDQRPDFPDLPGAWCCEQLYTIEGPSGVWRAFAENVARREIPVLYETRAVELVQDPDSLEIFGVVAEQNGGRIAIKARRAVVVCTGGFAANFRMQRDFGGFQQMYSAGSAANTGDGVLMLQKAGADLWHMKNFGAVGGIFPGLKFPELDSAFLREFITASSWIDIAKDDQRFYDETGDYFFNHFKLEFHGTWVDSPFPYVLPVHMLFDEATRTESKIAQDWSGWNMIALEYPWSPDNSDEVAKGWIVKADSIRELAAAIGRDADAVEATVQRWNDHCAAGHDPDFGRAPERLKPIAEPPFYAVELVPAIPATSGGGRRNAEAQVLTPAGEPIPRLYEAGELGSTFANLYQNGSFLTEAIAFGRIAGRNAARERSWEDAVAPAAAD